MHKLLVFDLDGTLAELGRGILPENVAKLNHLQEMGYRIAICSGKPTFYLCGMMRQVGLSDVILIGENGGTFQFGIELPPQQFEIYPCDPLARRQIRSMRERIDEVMPRSVFYQPNELGLTPFLRSLEEFELVQNLLDENPEQLTALQIYRHADCFDLMPKEINKRNGLTHLSRLTGIGACDMIAIGDGVNDLPMFEYADLAIGIGERVRSVTDLCFSRIGEALQLILEEKL